MHRGGEHIPKRLAYSYVGPVLFKTLSQEASKGAWSTSPKAIRGSELLLHGLLVRDQHALMAKGQWTSLAMPKEVHQSHPEMLAREENIRDFLEWFQALLTVNVEDFAKQVGIRIHGLQSPI